jgi:hypothetical protein
MLDDPRNIIADFLRSRVVDRFHEYLVRANQRLLQAQREVDDLRGAGGTIACEVVDNPAASWFLNFSEGRMVLAEEPGATPVMTALMTAADWETFIRESGPQGLLNGGDRPLGRGTIDRLLALKGSIRIVVTGLDGGGTLTITLRFGGDSPAEPKVTLQLPSNVAAEIRAGALNPQAAFTQGQMTVVGDMGFAMQLAMALLL